jgi:hypothetical protein
MYPPTQAATGARRGPGDGVVRTRCRSFCFLQRGAERWTAFLITYLRSDGQWRGYFNFRTAAQQPGAHEVRTADLFVEESEAEVDQRARGLGRPLLTALLESALHAAERRRGVSPDLQQWFRELVERRQAEQPTRARGGGAGEAGEAGEALTLEQLRALYDSYRLDQVTHLIALFTAADFRELVEILLDGRRIDFRGDDRLQLAMSVVQHLERRLPLPPFELWVEDYLAHPTEYRRYSAWLHGGGNARDEA